MFKGPLHGKQKAGGEKICHCLIQILAKMGVLLAAVIISSAAAHGGLTIPVPRNNYGPSDPANWTLQPGQLYVPGGPCAGDVCLWFNEGCWAGCDKCTDEMPPGQFGNYYGMPNASFCTPTAPTLPEQYRTWNIGNPSVKGDFTRFHPWRSPGRAPVSDPCGVSGGYLVGVKGAPRAVGSNLGDKGSKLPPVKGVKTIWFAGKTEEVGFMLGANHGGGYSYVSSCTLLPCVCVFRLKGCFLALVRLPQEPVAH
jgi:hypothetical protein